MIDLTSLEAPAAIPEGTPGKQRELIREFSAVLAELDVRRQRSTGSAEWTRHLAQLAAPVRKVAVQLAQFERPHIIDETAWSELRSCLDMASHLFDQVVWDPSPDRHAGRELTERADKLDELATTLLAGGEYAGVTEPVRVILDALHQRYAKLTLLSPPAAASNFLEFPVTMHCDACGWERHSSRGDRKNTGSQVREHIKRLHPAGFPGIRDCRDALDKMWKGLSDGARIGPVRIYLDATRLAPRRSG